MDYNNIFNLWPDGVAYGLKNERNMVIYKINSSLPLYKLDQFVNNFRKKYENIFIDVKISKEEYLVLISHNRDD